MLHCDVIPGIDQNGGNHSGNGITETVVGGIHAESQSKFGDIDHETTADDSECTENVRTFEADTRRTGIVLNE